MKVYEFQNHLTHRRADVLANVAGYPGYWFVLFYDKGEPDYNLKGTTEPGTAEKRFTNEASAVRSAKHYVTKHEQGVKIIYGKKNC